MNFFETELVFIPREGEARQATRGFGKATDREAFTKAPSESLGIRLRLGDRPLVYNLSELARLSGKSHNANLSIDQDFYLIVHAISATRTQGRAKVEELQYFASATEPANLQTIDLVPKTRFNQLMNASLHLEGALDLFGEMLLDVPSALADQLMDQQLDLGPGLRLELSASARFIGRFTYSLQVPVVQASGVGSGTCCWVLRPNEEKTPLLGDQLLVQSIAVPKGTKTIRYVISGRVKADKGVFWKRQEMSTPEYEVEVKLTENTF